MTAIQQLAGLKTQLAALLAQQESIVSQIISDIRKQRGRINAPFGTDYSLIESHGAPAPGRQNLERTGEIRWQTVITRAFDASMMAGRAKKEAVPAAEGAAAKIVWKKRTKVPAEVLAGLRG